MIVELKGLTHDRNSDKWYLRIWVDSSYLFSQVVDDNAAKKLITENKIPASIIPEVPHHTHYDFDKSKIKLL